MSAASPRPNSSTLVDRAAATFLGELTTRVSHYFEGCGRSRKANATMIAKIVMALLFWALTYAAIWLPGPAAMFFVAYMVHGLSHAFLVLNIGHDANHGAISEHPIVNSILALSMDLCGINSRIWRQLHHRAHHYCVNVEGEDEALTGRGLLRFSHFTPWRPWQRLQHLYAPLAYAVYSLEYVLAKDVRTLLRPRQKGLQDWHPSLADWTHLAIGKLVYFSYMVALPIWVLGRPIGLVLGALLAAHALIGITVVLVFQTTHVIPDSQFPEAIDSGLNFGRHVIATTRDVATGAGPLSWLVGGLNHHVIHHLFPGVCHVHYPQLTPLIRDVAFKHGLTYRDISTFGQAVCQHFRHLKDLAQPS